MDERELNEATDRIVEICRKQIASPPVEIHPDVSLVSDLALDSLQALELISEVESAFGVSIPAELLPEIDTIRDVARMVMRVKLAGA